MNKKLKVFTIPGLYGSGPDHWQTRWEKLYGFSRIEQDEWNDPEYVQWKKCLCQAIVSEGSEYSILIAHSLGCHLVAKSYSHIKKWTKGIFFVAPPNLDSCVLKKDLTSFKVTKPVVFECPSCLIYSESDPFADVEYSRSFGLHFCIKSVNIGSLGHINSESHLENWDEGYSLFTKLVNQIV